MDYKHIDINLSRLLKKEPKLIPGELVELKMIEYYKYYQREDDSIYLLFTKYLLKRLFMSNGDFDVSEINNFFREDVYESTIAGYNNELDLYIILNLNNYDFKNVVFDKIIKRTEDELIVRFKIIT